MEFELEPMDDPTKTENDRERDRGVYMGNERRRYDRRRKADRRAMVRFGASRADRRSGKDRRKGNGFWESMYTL